MIRFDPPPKRLTEGAERFKIKPARYNPYLRGLGKHYWVVLVFPNIEALREYGDWRTRKDPDCGSKYSGMSIPCLRGRGEKVKPKLGEIILADDRLGASVISHECIHAAATTLREFFGRAEAVALGDQNGDIEERFAYTQCTLVRQIVDKLYRVG